MHWNCVLQRGKTLQDLEQDFLPHMSIISEVTEEKNDEDVEDNNHIIEVYSGDDRELGKTKENSFENDVNGANDENTQGFENDNIVEAPVKCMMNALKNEELLGKDDQKWGKPSEEQSGSSAVSNKNDKDTEMEQEFIVDISSIGETYEDSDVGQLEFAMGKIRAEYEVIAQFIHKIELFAAELLWDVCENKNLTKNVDVGSKWQYLGN
ncbi:hypothetical protein GH714_025601 [Hevea brasiliensis]|uniref:Uncharacterized protein n=1 Tax=Hevea brasiliensis TaxID=3981 RepID=A0A6A6MYX2_HEVBR|nr:hypothetical protein GH714_025601 [Hevea brasiliensis]